MKNILFVGYYPNPEDIYKNVFFQNLVHAIAETGVKCTVVSPVSIMHYGLKSRRIPYSTIETTKNGKEIQVYYPKVFSASSKKICGYNTERISERLFENGVLRTVRKLSKQGQCFDAVYGHFFLYGGLAAIKVGRLLNISSFVAFGECDYESQVQETYGDLTQKDIAGLNGVIAVSTKNANRLKDLGIFDNIPMIIAPNSVDQNLFYPMNKKECREQLGLPIGKFIVGFVGGFIERKGDKRLLEAVSNLEDTYVAFAGKGDAPKGDRVVFCKALEHDKIPIFLSAMDIFCLPTLNEGSCNAIVEAAACGLSVISSDLPFNDDLLNDTNSIRIDPKSVDEIGAAIKQLRDDENLRKRLSSQIYKDVQAFRIENRCLKILNFIQSVIEEGKDD